ncbi:MAG TPA: adenosine deaminase [Thermoanaerobaculia bacterium]|jgi:adenosine deaminase|nr:adenosine deaminase [Thermoanaerobaculia bacterium]
MRNGYPLVELHRHLDGNVRLSTVLALAREHRIPLPADTEEALRPHVQVTNPEPDLLGFLAKFALLRRVMIDLAACRRIARENVEDAAREGIDHIELRFSPYFMAEEHELDPLAVAEAVCDGVAEGLAHNPSVSAKLIGIVSRNYGPEIGWIEVEAAIRCRDRGVVALDLAGDEANFPGTLFVDHFHAAREAGLRTIAHAGEAAGAESVRQAIEDLEAERIGHGIRSVDDESVLDLIAERNITLEVCPTSNVQTSTVPSLSDHPLPFFLARGLRATLSTDDPSISGIDLAHEYRVAAEGIGLSESELRVLQENALEAAFLTPEERGALVGRG